MPGPTAPALKVGQRAALIITSKCHQMAVQKGADLSPTIYIPSSVFCSKRCRFGVAWAVSHSVEISGCPLNCRFFLQRIGKQIGTTSKASEMEQILDQLGSGEGLPVDAIRAANANRAAMVPLFLRRSIKPRRPARRCKMRCSSRSICSANGARKNRPIDRSPLSCRRPAGEVEPILADAATETTHRVMASTRLRRRSESAL